ncbi:hypothetical protein DV738_g4125, partial [Chaetothyriales sp. CBS 135597]
MTPPSNLYKTPTALPAIGDGPPSLSTVSKSLSIKLLAADNTSTTLGEALARTDRRKVLVILIRHFYCTNCQEYIRQMSKSLRRESLARRDTSVIIIGCGDPTLIEWYVQLTQTPYPVYVDPNTRLYKLLGTHRTVSQGTRRPSYVQHSLLMGNVMLLIQGIKRLVVGDVRKAGNLMVNGGEVNIGLLGQQRPPPKRLRRMVQAQGDDASLCCLDDREDDEEDEEYDLWGERKSPSYLEEINFWAEAQAARAGAQPQHGDWKIWWCHRMRNARDHTEIDDLRETMGLSTSGSTCVDTSVDTHHNIKLDGNGTAHYSGLLPAGRFHALKQSNQSWMSMLSSTTRRRKQADNSLSEKTKVHNRQQNGISEKTVSAGDAIG